MVSRLRFWLTSAQINQLFRMVLYVRKNEETSILKIVHFYDHEKGVPSELEANVKSKFTYPFSVSILKFQYIQSWTKRSLK